MRNRGVEPTVDGPLNGDGKTGENGRKTELKDGLSSAFPKVCRTVSDNASRLQPNSRKAMDRIGDLT